MAGGDLAFLEQATHAGRELQQAEGVGHGGAVLAHGVGDLLLRGAELLLEPLVALGLFDRIEVGALQILHERERERLAVVDDLHQGGDLRPTESGGGAVPSLTCDQLEARAAAERGVR